MSFFKDLWITSSAHFFHLVISFLNTVIITRYLGPEGRGKYIIITNLIVLFSIIFGEGIRRRNTIEVGKSRESLTKLIFQTFNSGLIIFFIFIILYLTSEIWRFIVPNVETGIIILGLLISLFSIQWQAIQALHLGLKKIPDFNILQVLPVFLIFVINLVGIYLLNFALIDVFISIFLGNLFTFLYSVFGFRASIRLRKIKESNQPYGSLIILKSTISAILILLILKGDLFLINFYLGSEETGIYSIPVIFSDLIQKIPTILGLLIISRTVSDKSGNSVINTAKIVRAILFINLFIAFILFILGKDIITLLFSSKFIKSYDILVYLLPAFIFFGPGAVIYSYFIGKAFPKQVIIINTFIALLNLSFNVILVPIYGIKASAIISSSTYLIWTMIYIILYKKDSNITYKDVLIIRIDDLKYMFLSFRKMFIS
jgi:O-antigen/teichoic acid export membrane protein